MDINRVDYLIIGGGPAGLQLGYYLDRKGYDYLILERGDSPGEFFKTFPRHRKLISINKVYTGHVSREVSMRWDWNSLLTEDYGLLFKEYDKDYFPDASNLVRYLKDFAEKYALKIRFKTQVTKVEKREKFIVNTDDETIFQCDKLVVATGFAKEYQPEFEGMEYVVPYSQVSVDPEQFINKRVMIFGKGNSAFETANSIINHAANIHLISPDPVILAWKSHYVGDLRAVNNNILDTYQLKSQNSVQNAVVKRIVKRESDYDVTVEYTGTNGEERVICVDYIISCTGFHMDDSIFAETALPNRKNGGIFPELTSEWESVNVANLYFAGSLMHGLDYKKAFSGFIHGFRYNIAALAHIFEAKYHDKPWPMTKLKYHDTDLAVTILEDLVESSALFQQPGFLGNVLSFGECNIEYYRDVPVGYVNDKLIPGGTNYIVVTLEYGKHEVEDPFDTNSAANESTIFLHPVLRYCVNGTLIRELHLRQDLEHNWGVEINVTDLKDWFEQILSFDEMRSFS